MELRLFSFLRGYLIIKVSGFSVERFINLAMNRNIYLSDIKYKDSYVLMKVSIKGFKHLKPIAKKTRCRIKIVKKCGLPFYVFRYRKRKILFFGIIFFILTIYMLSTRIWLINIDGLDRVYYQDLENYIKNEGIYLSAKKAKIDKEEVKEKIVNDFDDIAWVNINIKGTKVTLEIKETIEKKEIEETNEPANIIAKKDGIIEQIVVERGMAVVKPFDVVSKGDMLIDGTLTVKEDEFGVLKSYVHSNGKVEAKTYYRFKFDLPFEYEQKQYTGKKIVNTRLNIFNKKFDFFNKDVKYDNYTRVSVYNELNLGEDYPLPFIIIKDTYSEFTPVMNYRTLEETKALAEKIADNKILREIAFDVNIVDKKIDISENEYGIDVLVEVSCIEDIGQISQIELEDNDDIEDTDSDTP